MSYDGFYGNLSTRGTVSELLNQANSIKVSIEASAAEVAADTLGVDWKHEDVTIKAAQVQTDANLVSTKAQDVTLKAIQVQANATLVETKAQEVQDNSDYVAGIVADYSPVVIDDAAGLGDTNKTWSADKSSKEIAGKAATTDPRLTDAREWTAATVTQAEAEAGTAITRRAFTSQRVRQAIVAWFNGISGALGRTILTRTTADQVRSDIGLGTSATKNVGTAADNVMQVGAGGVIEALPSPNLDANELQKSSKILGLNLLYDGLNPSNAGSPASSSFLTVGGFFTSGLYYGGMLQFLRGSNRVFYRSMSESIPNAWVEFLHTGNLLQTTGTSTDFPMSQKAVTDAIANIPSVTKTVNYTVTVADKGKSIDTTSDVTIPSSVFEVGDIIVVTNLRTTNRSIIPAPGVTFHLAGTESTGLRTLAVYGVATFRMVSHNVWLASGAGLS